MWREKTKGKTEHIQEQQVSWVDHGETPKGLRSARIAFNASRRENAPSLKAKATNREQAYPLMESCWEQRLGLLQQPPAAFCGKREQESQTWVAAAASES